MYLIPKTPNEGAPEAPANPTDMQRHEMIFQSLIKAGRSEDYENIIINLEPPPDITTYALPGQYKGVKVAVVGSGLAGLAAAFELRKLGFDITVFESEEQRIGGRVYTHYFDKEKNLYGELGAARIPASHGTSWHYINLFNLNTTKIEEGKGDSLVYVRDIRARNNPEDIMRKLYPQFKLTPSERNTPWPDIYTNVLNSALKRMSPQTRSQMLRVIPFEDFTHEYLHVVIKSVRQALVEAGLSEDAIALVTSLSPTVNAFIDGSFYTELITEYGLFTKNTYSINGGMSNLPLAFYKSLVSDNPQEYGSIPVSALGNVTFKMGSWVARVYMSYADEKVGLKYYTKASNAYETFDYVILAIPMTSLRKMYFDPYFSNSMMEAIREVVCFDAQKAVFLCSERFWEKKGITGGVTNTDLIIQSIIYPQDRPYCSERHEAALYRSPDVPDVLTASYNIGNDAIRLANNTEEYHLLIIKRQIEIIHNLPEGYLNGIITDQKVVDWNGSPWVTGAFVNFLPGQQIRYLFNMAKPDYNNRVYFAGEAYHPPNGWIQAALQSAMTAVDALAYYLKTYGKSGR